MQSKFLLLLAICTLATALPRDKRSVESHSQSASDESGEVKSTTTAKPLPSKIITIKDNADLKKRISQAGDNVVIIYVMTTWCLQSRRIGPIIEDIAVKTENLTVLKVDVEDFNFRQTEDTIRKYGLSEVRRVPTFIFIKDGKKVEEISVGDDAAISSTLSNIMSPTNDSNSSDSSDE